MQAAGSLWGMASREGKAWEAGRGTSKLKWGQGLCAAEVRESRTLQARGRGLRSPDRGSGLSCSLGSEQTCLVNGQPWPWQHWRSATTAGPP